MGIAVVDDVDVANGADALEEVFDIVLGSLVGKVPDIETT